MTDSFIIKWLEHFKRLKDKIINTQCKYFNLVYWTLTLYIWGQIIYKDQGHIDRFYQKSMLTFNKEYTETNVPVRFWGKNSITLNLSKTAFVKQ